MPPPPRIASGHLLPAENNVTPLQHGYLSEYCCLRPIFVCPALARPVNRKHFVIRDTQGLWLVRPLKIRPWRLTPAEGTNNVGY